MLTSKTKSIQLPFEPKQLNFAIFGTITFTINGNRHTCRNMRLAQGHDSTGNNWWIAGPGCFGITSEGVLNCRKWIPGPSSWGCGVSFKRVDVTCRFQVAELKEEDQATATGTHDNMMNSTGVPALNGSLHDIM